MRHDELAWCSSIQARGRGWADEADPMPVFSKHKKRVVLGTAARFAGSARRSSRAPQSMDGSVGAVQTPKGL